jgi:hypothetical protein
MNIQLQRSEELFAVFHDQGAQLPVTRREWIEEVLPKQLDACRDDRESTYQLLATSLEDQLGPQLIEVSRKFLSMDKGSERSVVALAISQLQADDISGAEATLSSYRARQKDTPDVLINLAKIHAARGEKARACDVLERAMELDPNHEGGLPWFAALMDVLGRDAEAALARLAMRPEAYRPQLLLVERAIGRRDLDGALHQWRAARASASDKRVLARPAALIIFELLQDGRFEDARALFAALESLDLQTLAPELWSIGSAIQEALESAAGDLQIEAHVLPSPLWLSDASPSRSSGPAVLVASFSDETEGLARSGALARGFALGLAEVIGLETNAVVSVLVETARREGFWVPRSRRTLHELSANCPKVQDAKILVTGRLAPGATSEEVTLDLEIWAVRSKRCIKSLRVVAALDDGLFERARALLLPELRRTSVNARPAPPDLAPRELSLGYIDALSSLSAQQLVASDALCSDALWNEASAFDAYLALSARHPDSASPRLMAASALLAWRKRTDHLGSCLGDRYRHSIIGLLETAPRGCKLVREPLEALRREA